MLFTIVHRSWMLRRTNLYGSFLWDIIRHARQHRNVACEGDTCIDSTIAWSMLCQAMWDWGIEAVWLISYIILYLVVFLLYLCQSLTFWGTGKKLSLHPVAWHLLWYHLHIFRWCTNMPSVNLAISRSRNISHVSSFLLWTHHVDKSLLQLFIFYLLLWLGDYLHE